MKKVSQIKVGAIISYIALALNIVLGLIYTPWMKDVIGIENHGLYTLATSLISIFMLDFGLGSAVSRFVAKYRAEGNQEKINDIIGLIYKLYIAIDVIIVAVLATLFFFIESIYQGLTSQEIEQFKVLYLIVAGFNIISFPFSPLSGILNAYEKFIQLKICSLISKISTVVFVVIALCFSSNVVWVVLANAVSGIMVICIKLLIIKSTVPVKINLRASGKNLYKTLFSFTMWTTIVAIMQRFTHSFAPTVLGITSSAREIGLYSPAVTIEGYFYLLATAVNGLFLPRVSKYIADKQEGKISELMLKVGRYQLLFLGLIFTGFVCVGKDFMVTWMRGAEYEKSYYSAVVILFPTLLSTTMQIASTTIIAKKMVHYNAICMIVTGVLGLGLSYWLSFYIGSVGVCIGTAFAALSNLVFMNFIYHKKLGINMLNFYKKCYLRALPCFAVTIGLGLLIGYYIPLGGWLGIFVKGCITVAIFTVIFFAIYFTMEEKKKIFEQFKNILCKFRRGKKENE